jgi:predicted nuclease with TOPRIM domain
MDGAEMAKIEEIFKWHIGVMAEDFQHKLDIVVDGQQMLAEKMDRMEERLDGRIDGVEGRLIRVEAKVDSMEAKLDNLEVKVGEIDKRLWGLETKVDGIANDLAAHRADTEGHSRGYLVSDVD